jgi:mannan endo-1,4-beta-mannosidase
MDDSMYAGTTTAKGSPRGRAGALKYHNEAPLALPWIEVAPGAPYFVTEHGEPWTPIGQNDADSWPDLYTLFGRRDVERVEAHVRWLAEHGVTMMRLMLECAQHRYRYLERPIGHFVPNMVRLWDDLFALCEKYGIRLLLTPYDTFWTWRRWKHHPLNQKNGGPCARRGHIILCPKTRQAIKDRFTFAIERWGGSGVLFAWDLWNEIHPAHAGDAPDCVDHFEEFIADLGEHVRSREMELYGRSHPQTVSLFGPELHWRPQLPLAEPIFRHPALDFATTHVYMEGTIDHPQDTVAPAIDTGRLVRRALAEIRDGRPYLDSEHGPIHTFKDHKITLPEPFDDEYFRHMQWAHFASGAAGGGMRWPNRHPHVLTHGMRAAQRALAGFVPLIDWPRFQRHNWNEELQIPSDALTGFACGDDSQAIVWLLRTDTIGGDGTLRQDAAPVSASVRIPALAAGRYRVMAYDTARGEIVREWEVERAGEETPLELPPIATDLAIAVRRAE